MCSKVVRIGDQVGAAATVKMINQLLVGVHVVATSEALALAARAGADPAKAYEVISNGGGNSSVFEKRAPNMLAGNPEAKGTVDIFLKDLGIVLEAGRQHQLPLPLTASAYQQFMSAAALGGDEDPNPSVLKVYEALGGMNVADITKNAK